ncbi:MAG: YecA family protein [Nitrospirae bacterium]|nr:YecA family protein [Nitrospirota bacterium]
MNQTPQRTLGWLHSNEALERLFKDKNRQGDEPPRNEPEDHAVITKILKKIGSGHTLHELYGLFYGCAAATHPVPPSGHLPIIFDPETAKFESEQDAKTLLEKMLTLWNMIATWDPQGTDFFFPPTKYPVTVHGVLTRSGDLVSFVHYFIKGLDVGRTEEGDFSEDASAALQFCRTLALSLAAGAERAQDPLESAGVWLLIGGLRFD